MSTSEVAAADVGGRRALIDATVAAIEEDGLGVSLRAITRRAEVSHAAPAYHFKDKAGLFTAVACEGFEMLHAALAAALDGARRQGPAKRMEALGIAYVGFAITHRAHFEVMFRPELLRPDSEELHQAGLATFEILRETVRSAQDDGYGAGIATDDLVLACWAMVHGIVQLTIQGVLGTAGFSAPTPELAARLAGLFSQSFGKA